MTSHYCADCGTPVHPREGEDRRTLCCDAKAVESVPFTDLYAVCAGEDDFEDEMDTEAERARDRMILEVRRDNYAKLQETLRSTKEP